jgi:hypothetical protein
MMSPTREDLMRTRLVAALAVVAFASGCYHNPLPDYAPRIRAMTLKVIVPPRPYVQVDTGGQAGGLAGAMQMVATGVSIGIASGVRQKLRQAVPSPRVLSAMQKAFHGDLAGDLPFPLARGPADQPTARLEVQVTAYGVNADNAGADVTYGFYTQARLIYLPEAKILWEGGTRADVPVTWTPSGSATIPVMTTAGAQITNLTMLQQATAARFQQVFDALAHDAAAVIARDLNQASARH